MSSESFSIRSDLYAKSEDSEFSAAESCTSDVQAKVLSKYKSLEKPDHYIAHKEVGKIVLLTLQSMLSEEGESVLTGHGTTYDIRDDTTKDINEVTIRLNEEMYPGILAEVYAYIRNAKGVKRTTRHPGVIQVKLRRGKNIFLISNQPLEKKDSPYEVVMKFVQKVRTKNGDLYMEPFEECF